MTQIQINTDKKVKPKEMSTTPTDVLKQAKKLESRPSKT